MYYSEFGGVKNGFFGRNNFIAHDNGYAKKVETFITDRNNTDVYQTAYCYDNTNTEEALLYGDLYFDLDCEINDEEDFRRVKTDAIIVLNFLTMTMKVPEEQVHVYYSGSKGFHIIVPAEIFGLKPKADLNEDFRAIAYYIDKKWAYGKTMDLRIYDKRRLFRIPNSINSKTGLYKVPLTKERLSLCTWASLKVWAASPREENAPEPCPVIPAIQKYKAMLAYIYRDAIIKAEERKAKAEKIVIPETIRPILPCVINVLKNGASEGQRNNTAVAMASSLLQAGRSVDDIEELMQEWNETRNTPPLPEREITAVVNSAYEQAKNGQGYGCNTFRELGYCLGSSCNLYK